MSNRTLRPQRRKPNAPRILTANQVSGLTWTKPSANGSSISEYRVYANGSFLDVTAGDTTTFFNLPVAGSVYQVSAVNAVGEGPKSRSVVAT